MKRTLFVENSETLLEALLENARMKGFEAEGVLDAPGALAKIRAGQYDAIVIDASEDVPVEGYKSLSCLLQKEFPHIRRIAFTGQVECRRDPLALEWYEAIIWKGDPNALYLYLK